MSCENCFKGYILPGDPTGSMIGTAYHRSAPASPSGTDASKHAIILLTDIFGLAIKNPRIIADLLSEKVGVDVWVPDVFNGAPIATVEELEPLSADRAGVTMSWGSKLRLVWLLLRRIPQLWANRDSVVDSRVKSFIDKVKEEKKYDKISVVGYCFGGSIAIRLASTTLIESAVICHPGRSTESQISAIKIPTSWVCAEDDMVFGPKVRLRAEAILAGRKGKDTFVDYEFKDWKGTAHGFAVRPNQELPEIKAAYEGALEQTAAWFKKTL